MMRVALFTAFCTFLSTPAEARPKPSSFGSGSWSAMQAVGAPDTSGGGDNVKSWAPQGANAGPEWLELTYLKKVSIREIRVLQNHNPGAIIRVTAVPKGEAEVVLWEGEDKAAPGPLWFDIKPERAVLANRIKIYLDTRKVQGWNEIDAVELISEAGERQWASAARASSAYGSYSQPAGPFTELLGQKVRVRLADSSIEGVLTNVEGDFLRLIDQQDRRVLIVRKGAIVFLEADSR